MKRIGRKVLILACVGLALTLVGTVAVVAQHEAEGHEQHFKMRVATVDQDGNVHEETIEVDGPRAFLGVMLVEGPDGGARVESIVEDSAAERAGLQEGDIIVGIDGDPIEGSWDLTRAVLKSSPGTTVDLEIERDGARQTVVAELGERDASRHSFSFNLDHGDWPEALRETLQQLEEFDPQALEENMERLEEMLGNMDFDFDFNFDPGDMHHAWAIRSARPRLGVELVDVTAELREHLGASRDEGLLVGKVQSDTPAEQAGVEVGDLIVAIDGESIDSDGDLIRKLRDRDGETFNLEVIRDGRPMTLGVSLPDRDERDVEPGQNRHHWRERHTPQDQS